MKTTINKQPTGNVDLTIPDFMSEVDKNPQYVFARITLEEYRLIQAGRRFTQIWQ